MPRCAASLRVLRPGFVAALALVACAPLAAAPFTVNTFVDFADPVPGDSVCGILARPDGEPVITGCSLRAAIQETNALAGPDAITFDPFLDGTPMGLTFGSQLPAVTGSLTITGRGTASTIVQASGCDPVLLPLACIPATFRVLEVGIGANLALSNLTIRHGNCAGACQTRAGDGGGILNGGMMSVSAVAVRANRASNSGGGIENRGTIASVSDSTFAGNLAGIEGGGLDNFYGIGIGTIVRTMFVENEALYGGGLYSHQTGVVSRSVFLENTADYGGGIYADADGEDGLALVTDCTFELNVASTEGGGIYTDTQGAIGAIQRSLFVLNSAQKGGGLSESDGSMGAISNSTFSANTGTVSGGGIDTGTGTIAAIFHVTFTGNTSPLGAGVHSKSNVAISNSIFGANGAGGDCKEDFIDAGGNFSDDTNCDSAGAIVPGTGYDLTLADNGGPTRTHRLLPGSPAINATGACPSIDSLDQRGFARDAQCDSGAYEFNSVFADGFE